MAYLNMRSVWIFPVVTMNTANSLIRDGTLLAKTSICCYLMQSHLLQILSNNVYIILISLTACPGDEPDYSVLVTLCMSVCLWAPCAISSWHMNSSDEPRSAVCPPGEAFWLMWLASSCVSQCACICADVCLLVSVWSSVHVPAQVCEWEIPYILNYKSHHTLKRMATKCTAVNSATHSCVLQK